jgi:hypothetical protein
MNFRMFTLLLTIGFLHSQGALLADCSGCSRGQGLISEATAAAAAAGLPGLPGAAGLPGLAGAAGAPGVAGPAGTPGLAGGLLDYAMVFAFNQTVGGGAAILWTEPNGVFAPGSTFSHTAGSGAVVINSVGTYLARYIVSVDDVIPHDNPTTFAIFLGASLLPGSDRSSGIPTGAGQLVMAGEVIFRVDAAQIGLAASVANTDPVNATTIGNSVSLPSGTAASLFIQKISAN